MKSRFPAVLQQLYEKNLELILLRLFMYHKTSTETHCTHIRIPNLIIFITLNNNQRCHVCVQSTLKEIVFLNFHTCPKYISTILIVQVYVHSGVSPICENGCSVAMTWYQDFVLRHSTGSLPHLSTNINYYTTAFNTLCLSQVPSISHCGGCRLELLLQSGHLDHTQVCNTKIGSIWGLYRCFYFQDLSWKKEGVDVKDVVSYLTQVQ